MPFITQCPHGDCSKYMLLEDSVNNTVVECLVCKKPVQIGNPDAADDVVELEAIGGAEAQIRDRFKVVHCPKCKTPLRVPPGSENQAMQCTECDYWGLLS